MRISSTLVFAALASARVAAQTCSTDSECDVATNEFCNTGENVCACNANYANTDETGNDATCVGESCTREKKDLRPALWSPTFAEVSNI